VQGELWREKASLVDTWKIFKDKDLCQALEAALVADVIRSVSKDEIEQIRTRRRREGIGILYSKRNLDQGD
jgi:hypothetical protein